MNWWKDKETAARNLWNALGMIISSPQQPKMKMRCSNKRQNKKKKEKAFLWWPTQYIIWVFLFFPPILSISFYDRQWCFQWSAIPVHQRLYTSEASIIRPVIHKEDDRKCERQTSCIQLFISQAAKLSFQVSDLLYKQKSICCSDTLQWRHYI